MKAATLINRDLVLAEFSALIRSSEDIRVGFMLGSLSSNSQDEFSDLDFYVYSDIGFATRDYLDKWLGGGTLRPSLHYWTGLEKHRLVISGVRVDLCWLPSSRLEEVRQWPELFFDPENILKDRGGVLANEIAARSGRRPVRSVKNDEAALILNLFNVAIQVIRGEEINARSRFTGVLEAKARLFRRFRIGQAEWREPTRRAESDLISVQLSSLRAAAYLPNRVAFRDWLCTELLAVSVDDALASDVRDVARDLARRLAR